jgi:hypothetical protein
MYGPCKVLGSIKLALHKRFVDDNLGRVVRQFRFLPGFYLLSHGLEVALHAIDAH